MAENEDINEEEGRDKEFNDELSPESEETSVLLSGMYKNYFLDYASYVILERAVPAIYDGLKPVQRRILHSMRELEDGRYNKVANIIGNTMKYHPHGDASIGDAMVQLGQKELLIDMQGNWGNILTGDSAAAGRYIEARLSKFALHTVFNPKTTEWQMSYDGRNKEPIQLPIKFPLLVAQGAEGIAVGMACKILPHNFIEIIDACVSHLKGRSFKLYPDFPTGGMADVEAYNDGLRGGKVKVRAKLTKEDKKTLVITEIPFGTTTTSLIDSILRANDKGKIKIKKIEDNTSENVEILIHLAPGVSPDKTIDALYAFSDCEISISPNASLIEDDKPAFIGIKEMIRHSVDHTVGLLKLELEIRKRELEEQWHFASLERIFIEKRIYRDIEECETWESIIDTIRKGLKPHIKHLIREVTDDDIARLTEIRIKRISKFDSNKADDLILRLEGDIAETQKKLDNLIEFAIDYYKDLKDKFGKGRERKTEIKTFDTIDRSKVAVANVKLYVDKEEGFVGHSLKKSESEAVCECSDIDDVIVIREDGVMIVTKISSKQFVGKNLLHAGIWKKGDKRTIYNLIYQDGPRGNAMMKRFSVTSITRDKEYDLTKATKGSKVLYLTANPNGEAEVVTVILRQKPNLKKPKFDLDFGDVSIKGRAAVGNILSKHSVNRIVQKEKGVSTLGARRIWFDETVKRLNSDERGRFLGEFRGEDRILVVLSSGQYMLTGFDLTTHFDEEMIRLEKWNPNKPLSAVYFEGEKKNWYVKRFIPEKSDKKVLFISESEGSELKLISTDFLPNIKVNFRKSKGKEKEPEEIELENFIAVKGLKAIGNRLSTSNVSSVEELEPTPYDEPEVDVSDEQEKDSGVIEIEEVENKIDSSEVDGSEESNLVEEELEENENEEEEEEETIKPLADNKPNVVEFEITNSDKIKPDEPKPNLNQPQDSQSVKKPKKDDGSGKDTAQMTLEF